MLLDMLVLSQPGIPTPVYLSLQIPLLALRSKAKFNPHPHLGSLAEIHSTLISTRH